LRRGRSEIAKAAINKNPENNKKSLFYGKYIQFKKDFCFNTMGLYSSVLVFCCYNPNNKSQKMQGISMKTRNSNVW
jgi:hypothetical protein